MLYNKEMKENPRHLHRFMLMILSLGFLFSCTIQSPRTSQTPQLVVFAPHPLELIDPIISEFELDYGVQVNIVFAGTGELLQKIQNEQDQPTGDVMWGGAITTLEASKDLFHPYQSINEPFILAEHQNTTGHITRFSIIPSVIMVNNNLINPEEIQGYADLLKPSLRGKIAMANPEKSSSAFEHVINQLYAMGQGDPEAGWAYIERFLPQLEGQLLNGSPDVYRGVANGQYTVGLTFEEAAAKYVRDGAPVSIIYPSEGTIVKADGVAIIKNARNIEYAQKFIDFVTSSEIQTLIAIELNRRSVRIDVGVSEGLKEISDIYVIQDDPTWTASQKNKVLQQYQQLFSQTLKP